MTFYLKYILYIHNYKQKNMKTKIINSLKNIGEWIVIVIISLIFLFFWRYVIIFTQDHQWIVLILDVSCIYLLSISLGRNPTEKGKIRILFIINVLLLLLCSVGALWNYLIMLFAIMPSAIILKRKMTKIN